MKIALLFIATAIACGHHAEPAPAESGLSERELYDAASHRVVDQFAPGGRVQSFAADGSPADLGDSLIFTGLALRGLPCELGAPIEDQLIGEIHARGGFLQRHPSIPDEVSLDGALGLYDGAAWRVTHCAGSREKWAPAIALHRQAWKDSGVLNPGNRAELPKHFDYVLDALAGGDPSLDRLRLLEAEVATWAYGVVEARSACFRIHLGFLALDAVELLGKGPHRNGFCSAMAGGNIPLIDNWCGRGDLRGWVHSYQENAWVYRHQRCGSWETPDANGKQTPGIDFLTAMRAAYGF